MEFARGLPRRIERELNSRDPMSFIVLHEEIVNERQRRTKSTSTLPSDSSAA